MIKSNILRWVDYLGLRRWTQFNHRGFIREKREAGRKAGSQVNQSQRKRYDYRSRGWSDAEP